MPPTRLWLATAWLACIVLGAIAPSSAAADQSVGGILQLRTDAGNRPVAGVLLRVTDVGGTIATETRSDALGAWSIPLPEAGRYVVALDPASLPSDLSLREGANSELSITVRPGEQAIVLFPLASQGTADDRGGPGVAERLLQSVVDGLIFGAVLAVTAIGLSMIFGIGGVINFSHGDILSLGALLAVFLNAASSGPQLNLFLAAAVAVALVSCLGVPFDRLFRDIESRAKDHSIVLVYSIGLSFLLRHLLLFVFGPSSHAYRQFQLQDLYHLGPVLIAPRDAAVFAVSIGIVVAIGLLLTRTRTGWAMRAVTTNPGLAEQCGIAVWRVQRSVWVLGTGLAAMGGVLLAVSQQARWDIGYQFLMFMFAAVILGGIGTAFGAMLGGLLIGVVVQVSTLWVPTELKPAVAMLMLVAVLLMRPTGLLNRARRLG